MNPSRFAAIPALLASCAAPPEPIAIHDLVVYGATSSGVIAAVQAARLGLDVELIEPSGHIGGMTTAGLGATDVGNGAAVGGLAREFYRRIRDHYARDAAWVHERRSDFRGRGHDPGDDVAWTFEPKIAAAVLTDMLREAGITVRTGQPFDRFHGVEKAEGRIRSLRFGTGLVVRGRMFIDATYEGDLMAAAGVRYTVGREANARYAETLNGVQSGRAIHHQFTHPVDPSTSAAEARGALLPLVEPGPIEPDGTGDHRVQAYCFRVCTTDVPENRRPWPKPDDYDPTRYELLLRNLAAGDVRIPWHRVLLPNRKTDTNNNFAVSTDYIGANHAYPDADHAARAAIVADHEQYQKGLFWTLANDPRVPVAIRSEFSTWGLARDEFVENDNWPPQIYVREARRMVADVVVTEHHVRSATLVADPIGLGSYAMDSHHVRRHVDAHGNVRNEGDVQIRGFAPYPIPYGAITPSASDCRNLLVPVCVSASHIAFGSIRMEPVFMILGQSAAIAASIALARQAPVQEVPYSHLRPALELADQTLFWPSSPDQERRD